MFNAGLVFVTAFLTRKDMVRYLSDIAWETEVWIAESPDHLIPLTANDFLGHLLIPTAVKIAR
jgi:hypothetical protein